MRIYNTMSRSVEPFESIEPNKVGMYCCGPTVYNYAHIGNLRTYIFEDILRKVLEMDGYDVKHVMNITDVGHLTGDGDDGEDKDWPHDKSTHIEKFNNRIGFVTGDEIGKRGSGLS